MLLRRITPQSLRAAVSSLDHLFGFRSFSSNSLLHYERVEEADHPAARHIVAMPGLLGVGRNLRTFISGLLTAANANEASDPWQALLVDLRCHGKSPEHKFKHPHTMHSAAADVIALLKHKHIKPDMLIAHSFGGKTALEILRQLSTQHTGIPPPRHVWVLDSKPGLVDTSKGVSNDVINVLNAVSDIQTPIASREALYHQLEKKGFGKGLQLWLGSNLVLKSKNHYEFSFCIDCAKQLFDSYCTTSYWKFLQTSIPKGTTVHIVRAAKSDRWSESDIAQLQEAVANSSGSKKADNDEESSRGRVVLHELADSGHWVHQDNRQGLIDMILPSLQEDV